MMVQSYFKCRKRSTDDAIFISFNYWYFFSYGAGATPGGLSTVSLYSIPRRRDTGSSQIYYICRSTGGSGGGVGETRDQESQIICSPLALGSPGMSCM